MARFTKGDKVTVKTTLGEGYSQFTGKDFYVYAIDGDGDYTLHDSDGDDPGPYFNDDMLELGDPRTGDVLIDQENRDYRVVGIAHDGLLITEDQYDGTYDRRYMRRTDGNQWGGDGRTLRFKGNDYEYSMQEIAQKLGIPVNQLRIKK